MDQLQLGARMRGVLGLDTVVPREVGEGKTGKARALDDRETVLQLLPESRRGPVLDGEAGPRRDVGVLTAVEPAQLVAEDERRAGPVTPLPHLIEAKTQRLPESQQPLEVTRPEAEDSAVDASRRADQL